MISRREFVATTAAGVMLPQMGMAKAKKYVVPEEHMPKEIWLKTKLPANEIHIDPNSYRLYWTLGNGKAIRYVVGVGRAKLYEPGVFYVGAKKEWPSWRPTDEMIEREPHKYKKFEEGMPGGPNNPLGARALYLFYPNSRRDSFLRIHGTPQPWTIARAVSNGCARLVNDHVADLYNRVPIGTKVTLHERRKA